MFDITPDELKDLSDIDLRELVGRLCEAELVSHGFSPAAATWGGNQTAPDGGLDVRVSLPASASIAGFIPRPSTGFQVRTPDMPRADILNEMRPAGSIRPVIQELADSAGAYIIVSSKGSTADSALRNRRQAMREALDGVTNAEHLTTDLYDRRRLASWVRRFPGVIAWAKERIGKSLVGWRGYGSWSSAVEDVNNDYLLDDKLRLHLGNHRDAPGEPVGQAIDELRDELRGPGKIVRLVGLSGVGKTRLAQALFDGRVGARPLPSSLAVYTNLSDNPDPQPTGLASDLIANGTPAVLIVDNCPPNLHRRLSELCNGPTSTVSVLTVEYDVRDDQPEGTQVVTLDTSSLELIEELVRRRYRHLSAVDGRTVAEASGGNARIAIALAETVEHSETIAGLSNDDLFQRLFRQRHDPNNALLVAAQACSLVYSFEGEALTGETAELPRLAALAGQTTAETYRHVGELLRRDLVQKRAVWRAVLPHAIANRLAARALEDIPYGVIDEQLMAGGTDRLARSFSRRLSYLHDHATAVEIVERWLAPGGLLGDVTAFNDLGRAMFENVAPVLPEAALLVLERAARSNLELALPIWHRYLNLLRSIAYDPRLFERSTHLLAQLAVQSLNDQDRQKASDTLVSLFTIYLSGTHATIEQRLGVVEQLLRSNDTRSQRLGLRALGEILEASHFSSGQSFEFGARSRDYGYWPRQDAEIASWYRAALRLIERLVLTEGAFKSDLRTLLARNFGALWAAGHVYDELETLSRRFAADEFWPDGWSASRLVLQFSRDDLTPEIAARLSALEADLRPSDLLERVRAIVLSDRAGALGLEDLDIHADPVDRSAAIATELGTAIAIHSQTLEVLLPELLRGGNKTWEFGQGLAGAAPDVSTTWGILCDGLGRVPAEERDVQVLRGFIAGVWRRDMHIAQRLLDLALDHPVLVAFLPVLHSAAQLDDRGIERLQQALRGGQVSVGMYRNLALGSVTDNVTGRSLRDLLVLIADQPDGFDTAIDILYMRLHSDRARQREYEPELVLCGQDLLRRVRFRRDNHRGNHEIAGVVTACLSQRAAYAIAADVAALLRQAVIDHEATAYDIEDTLQALLEVQPSAVLDALFTGDERDQVAGLRVFDGRRERRGRSADIIPHDVLIAWCNADAQHRYPIAASIVAFARLEEASAALTWTAQANALLSNAPAPQTVLAVFIERFRPMTWSGSRAAIIEANARLLDNFEPRLASELRSFVSEAKTQLARVVASERDSETARDRRRDERFE